MTKALRSQRLPILPSTSRLEPFVITKNCQHVFGQGQGLVVEEWRCVGTVVHYTTTAGAYPAIVNCSDISLVMTKEPTRLRPLDSSTQRQHLLIRQLQPRSRNVVLANHRAASRSLDIRGCVLHGLSLPSL